MDGNKIDEYIKPGTRKWFEYHCWESHESCDAEVWYHSHQRVTVLECVNYDEYGDMTWEERMEAGTELVYRVRFSDGFEYDALEDELLDSRSEFERPNPPERKANMKSRIAGLADRVGNSSLSNTDINAFSINDTVGLSGHVDGLQVYDVIATGKVVDVDKKAEKVNVAWFQREGIKQHGPEELVLLWRDKKDNAAMFHMESNLGNLIKKASKEFVMDSLV